VTLSILAIALPATGVHLKGTHCPAEPKAKRISSDSFDTIMSIACQRPIHRPQRD